MKLLLNAAFVIAVIAFIKSKKSGNSFIFEYKSICLWICNVIISFLKRDRSGESTSKPNDDAECFYKKLNIQILKNFDSVKGWEPCAANTMYLVKHNQPFQVKIYFRNGLQAIATIHVFNGKIVSVESDGYKRKAASTAPAPEPTKTVSPVQQQVQPAAAAAIPDHKKEEKKVDGAAAFIASNYIADNGIEISNIANAAVAAGKSNFILSPGEDLPVLQLIAEKLVNQLKFADATVNEAGTITVEIGLCENESAFEEEDGMNAADEFDLDEDDVDSDELNSQSDAEDLEDLLDSEIIDSILLNGVTIVADDDLPDPDDLL